jgi:hypothetical protein
MQGEASMSDQPMNSNEGVDLPNGRGISLDQVRERLAAQHQTIVSADDPILMLVTLLNVFLAEEEQLLKRHNKALTTILAVRTDGYVQAVEQATATLGEKLSSASLESISKILETHGQKMDQFRSHMTWLAMIAGTSALINVAAFAALALR